MANIRFGGGIADARGSIGGTTLSRGSGGAIARTRVKGVNRRSVLQSTRRQVAGRLSLYWSSTLTGPERSAWSNYAAATPWANKLGDTIYLSGIAMFIRTNTLRAITGQAVSPTAPTTPGQATPLDVTATATASTMIGNITAIIGDYHLNVTGDTIIVYASAPGTAGQAAPHRGMKYVHQIIGNLGAPPTLPSDFNLPGKAAVGQKVSFEIQHLDETGRVSSRTRRVLTFI